MQEPVSDPEIDETFETANNLENHETILQAAHDKFNPPRSTVIPTKFCFPDKNQVAI